MEMMDELGVGEVVGPVAKRSELGTITPNDIKTSGEMVKLEHAHDDVPFEVITSLALNFAYAEVLEAKRSLRGTSCTTNSSRSSVSALPHRRDASGK